MLFMILKLDSQRDLQEAMRLVSWLGRPTVQNAHVSLAWFDEAERCRLAERVRFLFNDCGCMWGGPAFLFTFVAFFVPALKEGAFSWSILGLALLLGLVGAFIGKMLGLAWSYWRLKALLVRMMDTSERLRQQSSREVAR
jgi:hypothetical protein